MLDLPNACNAVVWRHPKGGPGRSPRSGMNGVMGPDPTLYRSVMYEPHKKTLFFFEVKKQLKVVALYKLYDVFKWSFSNPV